jgi:hypothetical protein
MSLYNDILDFLRKESIPWTEEDLSKQLNVSIDDLKLTLIELLKDGRM